MSEFKFPPISTLSGSTLSSFKQTIEGRLIEPKYHRKYLLTKLILIFSTPFHIWENLTINQKAKKVKEARPPVFILGHWRSGTTLLHNLLCQADNAAFVSTYQSVFPNTLKSKWIFKNFMQANMPSKRPSDNVRLNTDFPQEDEFALGNMMPYSYYNFFYFPKDYKEYYEKFVRFKSFNENEFERWRSSYKLLINKALINSRGSRAIIKNPVNTGRLKVLSEIFPEAKFIHIYRNPVVVYLSTKKFFKALMPTLWLHEVDDSFIIDLIFEVYEKLYFDFFQQKEVVASDRLFELKFEDFEKDPIAYLKELYDFFGFDDFEQQQVNFENYLKTLKGYKKNIYSIRKSELNRIEKMWGFALERWKYDLPENIKVVD